MAPLAQENLIHIIQGQFRIAGTPSDVIATLLGSCVAACLRDPMLGIGGMNHFLLPGSAPDASRNVKYGAHSMEELVNALLRRGAQRHRIEAQLFGGANVLRGLGRIGDANAEFARRYIRDEGFALVRQDLGGDRGRRLRFSPATGTARVELVDAVQAGLDRARPAPAPRQAGSIDLF